MFFSKFLFYRKMSNLKLLNSFISDEPKGYPHCGATMIDACHLISAGHCVRKCEEPSYVVLNGYDLKRRENEIPLKIRHIQRHPNSANSESGLSYDVALITLEQCFDQFPSKLGYICLPTESSDSINEQDQALIIGWGFANETTIPR